MELRTPPAEKGERCLFAAVGFRGDGRADLIAVQIPLVMSYEGGRRARNLGITRFGASPSKRPASRSRSRRLPDHADIQPS